MFSRIECYVLQRYSIIKDMRLLPDVLPPVPSFCHYHQCLSFYSLIPLISFFLFPHPHSIFSSFCYIFSCCNKLKNKAIVLVLVYARYFNRTEKPLSRSYRMIVFVPPFSKILCTVCEISNQGAHRTFNNYDKVFKNES